MSSFAHIPAVLAVLAASAIAACAGSPRHAAPAPTVQTAPATSPPTASAVQPPTANRQPPTPDAQFMQHMIHHHAQALAMTALLPGRAARPELRLLGERIDVSQRDEIAAMQRWLRERGHPVPNVDPAHAGHGAGHATPAEHAGMPGMLGEAEMTRLAAARGPAFDRLFLELMIRHHEGALTMVADLLRSPGGAQASEVFAMASDIEADQQAEIGRMRRLLATMGATPDQR